MPAPVQPGRARHHPARRGRLGQHRALGQRPLQPQRRRRVRQQPLDQRDQRPAVAQRGVRVLDPLLGGRAVHRLQRVGRPVQLAAAGHQAAQADQRRRHQPGPGQFLGEEAVLELQVVRDHHAAGHHPQQVGPDLGQGGRVDHVRVDDPVELRGAHRALRVDQGRVLVNDRAVRAEAHHRDLAHPVGARVQPGGLQVQRGVERFGAGDRGGAAGEVHRAEQAQWMGRRTRRLFRYGGQLPLCRGKVGDGAVSADREKPSR